MKNKIKKFFEKIKRWDWLLVFSILSPIVLSAIVYRTGFDEWIEKNIKLEVYHIYAILVAIITLLWTDKRYRQAKKQYKQTEDSIFKNKVNTIYLEVIKLLSDDETRKKPTAANLINSIQTSIETHYESEKDKKDAQVTTLNFQEIDLSSANLGGANLRGANLSYANLLCTNLRFAILTYANLRGAIFSIRGGDLIGVDLTSIDLAYTDLRGADLTCTDLRAVDLTGADLDGADLTFTALEDTNFENANLKNANLEGAELKGAELKGAELKGAKLNYVRFKGAKNIPKWIEDKLDDDGIYRE